MHLPPPPWEESKGGGVANNGLKSLVTALSQQRNSRELSLQLRVGLRDAGAEFSYVRMGGIRRLASTVETAAGSEDWAAFFHESQLYPQLQSKTRRNTIPCLYLVAVTRHKFCVHTAAELVTPLSTSITLTST